MNWFDKDGKDLLQDMEEAYSPQSFLLSRTDETFTIRH